MSCNLFFLTPYSYFVSSWTIRCSSFVLFIIRKVMNPHRKTRLTLKAFSSIFSYTYERVSRPLRIEEKIHLSANVGVARRRIILCKSVWFPRNEDMHTLITLGGAAAGGSSTKCTPLSKVLALLDHLLPLARQSKLHPLLHSV